MSLSAYGLALLAALSPAPSDTPPALRVPPPAPRELRAVDDVILTARMADGARAPSHMVLPLLANRADLISFMRANYPDSIRPDDAAVMPVAWVYIDEAGRTYSPELIVSAGARALDSLALAMVRRARFAPATVNETAVPVWVMLPVQLAPAHSPRDLPQTPRFTPYTKKPALLNRDEVTRALVSNYPPELRAQRISGTALIWLLVDETGRVARTRLRETSGQPKIDEAALRVAAVMRFSPAENQGREVPVWISLPIVFRAR